MDSIRERHSRQPASPAGAREKPPGSASPDGNVNAPHFAVPFPQGVSNEPAADRAARRAAPRAIVQFARTAFTVFTWEVRSFFLRPASYLLLLAATLAAGWGFSWLVTLLSQGATIALRRADHPIAQFLGPNVFLIAVCTLLVPLLTMNSIADERRRATWEQLLTAPVSPLAIVVGKFGAAWLLLQICLTPWIYHVGILRVWNGRAISWHGIPWFDGPGLAFDFGPVWGGCVGLLVIGGTFAAIGLFCSGLSRGPANAAILSLAAMGLVMLAALAPRVLAHWGFSADQISLVETVSCWGHLERFSRGAIEPRIIAGHLLACCVLVWGAAATCRRADEG